MKYLGIGLATGLAALSSAPAFAEETIAVFTKNLTNPYFQAVRVE
jgi:ABC-type sugar transport system substrate-binding protein